MLDKSLEKENFESCWDFNRIDIVCRVDSVYQNDSVYRIDIVYSLQEVVQRDLLVVHHCSRDLSYRNDNVCSDRENSSRDSRYVRLRIDCQSKEKKTMYCLPRIEGKTSVILTEI